MQILTTFYGTFEGIGNAVSAGESLRVAQAKRRLWYRLGQAFHRNDGEKVQQQGLDRGYQAELTSSSKGSGLPVGPQQHCAEVTGDFCQIHVRILWRQSGTVPCNASLGGGHGGID